MTEVTSILGVHVKGLEDGSVAVLLYKKIDGLIYKFCLDDNGDWLPVPEGFAYPMINSARVHLLHVG